MNSTGQTVSTDALIGIALFMIVIIFFFTLSSDDSSDRKIENLQSDGSRVATAVSGGSDALPDFVSGSKVDLEKLEEISQLDYKILKDALGVSADFCIHFEDDQGNVINVSGNKTGLGSTSVKVGGVACG